MDFIFEILTSLCAGAAAFCTAYSILLFIKEMEFEKEEFARHLPILFKLLMPLAGNLIPLARNSFLEDFRKRTKELILMAGYDEAIDEDHFTSINILCVILGFILCLLTIAMQQILIGIMIVILLTIYPRAWLNGVVKRRHFEIQKALPNVLDLLTLSVEAGKDFLTSLRDILARRRRDALGEELERAFREIQLGKQRRIALKELARRVQQPELSSVLNSIIQADELGVSIGQILRIQGDQLRMKRFNRAEKLANEAPVKILFPLALFIMPAFIIIVLGPILLKGLSVLFK